MESFIYAQLDESGICVGVSQLLGEQTAENMIRLDSIDEDKLGRKYENGKWGEKIDITPEPEYYYARAESKNEWEQGEVYDD